MRVNVIYNTNDREDHIIKRLVRTFETNFNLSDKPDSNCEINYFFPYLLVSKHKQWILDHPEKITIGWFTHLETEDKHKLDCWNFASKHLTIRITSCIIYYDILSKTGETYLIHSPLGV